MLIDDKIINSLCEDLGDEITREAIRNARINEIKFKNVNYENKLNFELSAIIYGNEEHNLHIAVRNGEIEDASCNCNDYYKTYGACKHSLETLINFSSLYDGEKQYIEDNVTSKKLNNSKYSNFAMIVNTIYNDELNNIDSDLQSNISNKEHIKIEPKIIFDRFTRELKVEFKIGNKRMYKIKNLSEFYIRMMNNENYKYGDRLQFVHNRDNFEKESLDLLDFIMKYSEIISFTNSNTNSNYRYYGKILNESNIILGNSGIDELFDILKNKEVNFQTDYGNFHMKFVDKNPDINFKLDKVNSEEYKITANFDIYKIIIFNGKLYKYVMLEDSLYRCNKEFEDTNLKLVKLFKKNYLSEVTLGKSNLKDLFSIIIPRVNNAIIVDEKIENELEHLKPDKLEVKVFLDFDEHNYIVADVRLCYAENEFNPLNEKEEKEFNFPRNIVDETKALNIFRKTGFMFENNKLRFILPDEDKIYEFLTEDIEQYMQKFEVLVTDNFRLKEITKPVIGTLGVKIENNLLSVDISKLNIQKEELKQVLEKYKLKKKYHRLKNGSFLDLEDSKEIDFLDKLVNGIDITYKELEEGQIRLPVNRSLYLNQLLKEVKGTEIIKDDDFRNIVNSLNKDIMDEENNIPENLTNILRPYQKIGFKWLKTLDNYKFGGILADDMGLGKTIQIITLISNYVQSEQKAKCSLVVAPSSLALNWENEISKFAPNLDVIVVTGNAGERKSIIENIDKYHIAITSYDLLKRDIEYYKEKDYTFRFIIADEAQYLKNNNTQNAKAIKQIKSDTRFALTGTPIENSLAELWSIFDFIMPGYLFSYKKFKSTYETAIIKDEDIKMMNKLKMLIEPFVLRRTKKEVLKELPDKTITVLNNEMLEEQKKIYMSYLMQVKQEFQKEIDGGEYDGNQIKILAALTRLRQICCHPALFLESYNYGSSKLEQCLEIVEESIKAGHKILLFSSYTSMFDILEKEIQKRNIRYSKLTGSTKVDERIQLVEEFNENSDIKMFFISLKAGGTGLNLTGADVVIHYDPWWNISAENQATDRAYRIGQKSNVQVYKLITKDSIEEKIYELQQKKAELTENMLNTNTTFVNKLSKEDIMKLFE